MKAENQKNLEKQTELIDSHRPILLEAAALVLDSEGQTYIWEEKVVA